MEENSKPNFYNIVTAHLKLIGDPKDYFKHFNIDDVNTNDKMLAMLENFGSMSFIYGNLNELLRNKAMGMLPDENTIDVNYKNPLKQRLETCGLNDYTTIDVFMKSMLKLTKDIKNYDFKEGEDVSINPKTKQFFDMLQSTKDLLTNRIKDRVADTETIATLKELMFGNTYNVGVEYAESLSELKDRIAADNVSYHDLILINSFVFEHFTITNLAEIQPLIVKLYEGSYSDLLQKAMTIYEGQKHALLYYESFVSLLETVSIFDEDHQVIIKNINDDKCSGYNIKNVKLTSETETEDEDPKVKKLKQKSSFDYSEYQVTQKDSIHVYLYKTLFNVGLSNVNENLNEVDKSEIDSRVEDIILDGVKIIFESEHKEELQNVILNGFKTKPNSVEISMWTKCKKLLPRLTADIKELNTEFDENVKLYIAEIDENVASELIEKITKLINVIIIPNDASEIKGIIFEQLSENKISTYKQLNQFIELIEKCTIANKDMPIYNEYDKFINDPANNIIDKLKLSIKLHDLQNRSSYYLMVQKYLKMFSIDAR